MNRKRSDGGASAKVGLDIGVVGPRDIPSTYGGYETFLTVLLPELVKRGHSVTVYVREQSRSSKANEYRGVRRIPVRTMDSKQLSTLSAGFSSALATLRARHDVVLAVNVANAIPFSLHRWLSIPVVLNTDGQEWIRGKWGRVARSVFHLSARVAGRTATALVSDSTEMRRIYLAEFNVDSTVIPYCWTDLPEEPNPAQTLKSCGVESDLYFVTAGRLIPENKADWIAEAYFRSGTDLPLLVLGTANYESPVRQQLERLRQRGADIRLLGHVNDRAKYRTLISHARSLIHGHTVGGINPALIEAMGSGALILAIDTPFNREALGHTGLLFRSQDDLRMMFADLAAQPSLGNPLRVVAAQRAQQVFSLEEVATAYEETLYLVAETNRYRMPPGMSLWQRDGLLDGSQLP